MSLYAWSPGTGSIGVGPDGEEVWAKPVRNDDNTQVGYECTICGDYYPTTGKMVNHLYMESKR